MIPGKKSNRPERNSEGKSNREDGSRNPDEKKRRFKKPIGQSKSAKPAAERKTATDAPKDANGIRLNRYIANSGVCSRRDADELIKEGKVQINGKIITEMGYKVKPSDLVKYEGKTLRPEKFVYVLLNKPKDFITTTDDESGRKTVMDLVKNACKERIFPVGRLDRNTTGILLLTNDGELSKQLTHPSYNVPKVYEVELNKPISPEDFSKLKTGIELEDGPAKMDEVVILNPERRFIGVEIHLGKNRIVRRMFESMGYDVVKLDRVSFAGLNKKDLPRGNYRLLEKKEIINLKHLKWPGA